MEEKQSGRISEDYLRVTENGFDYFYYEYPNGEIMFNTPDGYGPLVNVLQEALDQASKGKGKERHANDMPFMNQPIMVDGRLSGTGGPMFQARKKVLEAHNCPDEQRAINDLLGAIVYTAAMVLLIREGVRK